MDTRKYTPFILPMLVVLALSACGGRAATSQPADSPAGTMVVLPADAGGPAPENSAGQAAQPGTIAQPPVTPTPVFVPPTQEQSVDGFRVKVNAPEEIVVYQPEYEVSGEAPADTVVTVNDEILLVEDDQFFSTKVPLEEGPNLIEVVASNPDGKEVQFDLIATYQIAP